MMNRLIQVFLLICTPFSAFSYEYPIVYITKAYHDTPDTTTLEFIQQVEELDEIPHSLGGSDVIPIMRVALSQRLNGISYNHKYITVTKSSPITRPSIDEIAMYLYDYKGKSLSTVTFNTNYIYKYPKFIAYGFASLNPNATHFSWPIEVAKYYEDNVPIPNTVCHFTQDSITIDHQIQPNTPGKNTASSSVNIECSDPTTLRVSITPNTIKLGSGVQSVVSSPMGNVLQVVQGINPIIISSELTILDGVNPGNYSGSTIVKIDVE